MKIAGVTAVGTVGRLKALRKPEGENAGAEKPVGNRNLTVETKTGRTRQNDSSSVFSFRTFKKIAKGAARELVQVGIFGIVLTPADGKYSSMQHIGREKKNQGRGWADVEAA